MKKKSIRSLRVYFAAFFSFFIAFLHIARQEENKCTFLPETTTIRRATGKEEFFSLSFFSSFIDIGRRDNANLLIVLIGYISLSFCCCCPPRKESSDTDISKPRERKEKVTIYNSRIIDEKEEKHPSPSSSSPSTQKRKTDRCLAGASGSFCSFFFGSFVRSFVCFSTIAVRRHDVCLFFPSSSLSRLLCFDQSFSPLHTDAIITLLGDLVDYFSSKRH